MKNNKPILFGLIGGIMFFILCYLSKSNDETFIIFFYTMFFLPGITFPISTSYFRLENLNKKKLRIALHLIISIVIYYGSVRVFNLENKYDWITVFSGFIGSFLYLISTKLILKLRLKFSHIILAPVISAMSFLPYEIWSNNIKLLGLAILVWTITNSMIINETKKRLPTKPINHTVFGV